MSAYLTIGLPHHGKSLFSAKEMRRLLRRNLRWLKRTGQVRFVYSNLKVSEKWALKHQEALQLVRYWEDPMDLVVLQDVDIIWDEIARHIDSRDWTNLNPRLKKFIQEHDKLGIDIYANTQSPMQVDVMFRRNCEEIWRITKILGSRRPSPTKPPVRFIWGVCMLRRLKRVSFGKEEDQEEFESELFSIPRFLLIDRQTCEFFDTRQQISNKPTPLEHSERFCPVPNCQYHRAGKIMHA